MKDGKLKLKAKWLKEEVHTFICFQHDVNNDENYLCIGYILNYFIVTKGRRKSETKVSGIWRCKNVIKTDLLYLLRFKWCQPMLLSRRSMRLNKIGPINYERTTTLPSFQFWFHSYLRLMMRWLATCFCPWWRRFLGNMFYHYVTGMSGALEGHLDWPLPGWPLP